MTHDQWPALPYDRWKNTYATLHMWSQIAGKISLALAPPINHSWGVALHVSSRGLITPLLPHGSRTFSLEFDFVDHQFVIRTSDGDQRALPLEAQCVADFYRDLMVQLDAMHLPVKIWTMPVEVPSPIRFTEDREHCEYDPVMANRFWTVLVQVDRVFNACRASFVGKCSPVHFFWGGFDLAVSRFSGRPAPPRDGPAFMRESYSREVISHGFWPGSAPVLEPAFYAYAVPEPEGLRTAAIKPEAAYYHHELGEFILPYEAVRTSRSPEADLHAFVDSTYAQAATLAGWNRGSLERT